MKKKDKTTAKTENKAATKAANRFIAFAAFVIIVAFVSLIIGFNISPSVDAESGKTAEEGLATDSNTENAAAVQGGAFEVTDYKLEAKVDKNHSYEVVLEVSVDIPQQLQSIKFSLPSGNFRIVDVEVEGAAYNLNTESSANTVAIADPDRLGEGRQTYAIKYKLREFEENDARNDMFYFTALPPEWKQPIGKVDINISFPDDFPWDDIQCYAGQFGVQDINNRVNFEAAGSTKRIRVQGEKIPENYGITLKAELPDGYWSGALSGRWALNAILAVIGAVLLILALLWLTGGKDPKVEKSAETKPLKGIVLPEIGYIFNSKVGIRDTIMILIYFAQKGYLRISEYEPKRYRIYRLDEPVDEERLYRNAYSILFEDIYRDRAIEMEDLGERLMRVRGAIKDDIAAGYATAESSAFTPLSKVFRYISIALLAVAIGVSNALTYSYEYIAIKYAESLILAVIVAVAAYLLCKSLDMRESNTDDDNRIKEIVAGILLIGAIVYTVSSVFKRTGSIATAAILTVSAALCVFFIAVMRARGKDNAELVTKIRALRNFIYHPTPKELLENYIADSNYYYDMLQYALVFGAEESWAISFLRLNVDEPDWYSDDIEGHAFSNIREGMTTVDYAKDIKTFIRTIETAFADLMRRRRRR